MPSRVENLFRIRSLLDTPWPNAPDFHRILQQTFSDEMDIMNRLNISEQAWAVNQYQLNYTPGLSEYQINVSDFGRPILVVRHTTNPYVPYIPVPFDTINQKQYGTIWLNFWSVYNQWYAYPETLEHISFWRSGTENQQFLCDIQPRPREAVTYTVTYIPGYFGSDGPLNASPALSEHQELLRLRSATALLPYCRWTDDMAKDGERKKELAQAFAYQLERKEQIFDRYINSLTVNRMTDIQDWNWAS